MFSTTQSRTAIIKIIYKIIKNLLFSLIAIVLLSFSGNAQIKLNNDDLLSFIKKDISNKSYFLNEKNRYDYVSKSLITFVEQNENFIKSFEDQSNSSIESSIDDFKKTLNLFFINKEHTLEELRQKFEYLEGNFQNYDDYELSLNSYVEKKIISIEEKELILYFIESFYNTNNSEEFISKSSIFIHYINISEFSELEKQGMLTLVDGLQGVKRLISSNSNYKFLQFLQMNQNVSGKSKSTICAGNMIGGMLLGSIGGPAGFAAGFLGGFWECYKDGCFD